MADDPNAAAQDPGQRYDPAQAARVLARALGVQGGPEFVLGCLATIPGVVRTAARSGRFRSSPQRLQVGQWRYEPSADGRLLAAHVVGGIVIAELALSPQAAGPSIAAALGQLINDFGTQVVPAVRSVLEGLDVATGR